MPNETHTYIHHLRKLLLGEALPAAKNTNLTPKLTVVQHLHILPLPLPLIEAKRILTLVGDFPQRTRYVRPGPLHKRRYAPEFKPAADQHMPVPIAFMRMSLPGEQPPPLG